MTNSQGGSKGQQVNSSVKPEYQGDVNGFVSIRPGSQGEDESRADENGQDKSTQVVAPPQQLQGSLVQWERFLHIRSIKVMLVEDDDCTRHIVTALLRNCNYEVIQAANGFQAWKILENLSNHIDIVLTEVVMPCVSGISLLCKIMSHKTRKNIPVIMMSSHDSMRLVFKCLSKGAVDFLVKPIRKNELKNLWQHVWRRCHSSSGSGSESGTHAQKSVNSKGNLRRDNISKDGDDNGSSSDGSGTQSSWTKHTVEHERTESQDPSNQISEHPDSTCGIVIRSQPTRDTDNHKDNNEKDNEIAICKSKDNMENGKTEKTMNANANGIHDSNGVETGELGIKRARPSTNDVADVQNGCNVLRHSELSAFTRYNTTSNAIKGTPGITASCSQPENRSNIMKKESNSKRDVHSDGYIIYQGSSEQVIPRKVDEMTPGNVGHEELRIHHIHHHHHVHHYHNIETEEPLSSNHDEFGLKQLAADVSHCGSSNIMGGGGGGPVVEHNLENYSLNKSASGSKHGSNVPNAVNFEVTKVESDVGLGEKSASKIDHHDKSAQRKAALTKFRQKRELRCFQKKVRYQNRKKLAEQRPRVRGQFVKGNSSTNAADA